MKRFWPVGLGGCLIACAYIAIVLARSGWDPTAALAQGEEAHKQRIYAEIELGREVVTRPALGHDGKFFFILANDPWLLEPSRHAAHLDYPTYRAQRMLYPILAGGFGLFPAHVAVWGLIVVNLLAAGVGCAFMGKMAYQMGRTQWLGLVFAVSPGVLADLDISGSGALALSLALAATTLSIDGRHHWAVAALTGAVLARETMVLIAVGLFLWLWLQQQVVRLALVVIPALALLTWRVYAGFRLQEIESATATLEGLSRNFDLFPLRGAVGASPFWSLSTPTLIWIAAQIVFVLLFVRRAWGTRHVVGWIAWPFVIMALFLSTAVWIQPYDLARAIAPVFVAYPLLLFARDSASPALVQQPKINRAPKWQLLNYNRR